MVWYQVWVQAKLVWAHPPLGVGGGGVCVYIGGADLGVDAGLCFG